MRRFLFSVGLFLVLGGGCASVSENAQIAPMDRASIEAPVISVPLNTGTVDIGVPEVSGPPAPVIAETLEPIFITMTAGNFFFTPTSILAKPGQTITVTFSENEGTHTFVLEDLGIRKPIVVGTVITFSAPKIPGSYPYSCDVGAHQKLAMEGMLIVR